MQRFRLGAVNIIRLTRTFPFAADLVIDEWIRELIFRKQNSKRSHPYHCTVPGHRILGKRWCDAGQPPRRAPPLFHHAAARDVRSLPAMRGMSPSFVSCVCMSKDSYATRVTQSSAAICSLPVFIIFASS